MIRYPIEPADLIEKINVLAPKWIEKAHARTLEYKAAGRYTGGTDFWGEIKTVFIELQHEKCAYCETKLQGAILASKVHEVEHFRPKSNVEEWPNTNAKSWNGFKPTWPVGKGSKTGYYCLAYHPFNYAIACTRCNSTLKSSYFPIRGARLLDGEHPSEMVAEEALLIYPLSNLDSDPEDLIAFDGILAVARYPIGTREYERGITTIEFFQLNSEDLVSRRAEALYPLWMALEGGESQRAYVEKICAPAGEFASCLRAFRSLYLDDHAKAQRYASQLLALFT